MSELLEGFAPQAPSPSLHIHFQFVSVLFDLKKIQSFRFFNQGQAFTIFFSGCFNLVVNLFIGNVVLVLKCSLSLGSVSFSKACLFCSKSAVNVTGSQAYRIYENDKGVLRFHI